VPTLGDYLTQTRQLLRDPAAGGTWSDTELTRYITLARRRRDLLARLAVLTVSLPLTAGQSIYSLATVATTGSVVMGTTTLTPVDVDQIVLMPLGQTGFWRFPLGRTAPSLAQVWKAPLWQTWPSVYAMYGPDTVMLVPVPAQAYPAEWMLAGYLPDLVNTSDTDPIGAPWADAVPFGAAWIAKTAAQRFDEAREFFGMFREQLGLNQMAARPMALPYPWGDAGAWLDEML
jgi:hypothetical protein